MNMEAMTCCLFGEKEVYRLGSVASSRPTEVQNSVLSLFFVSVCCWRTCILYGNIVKSLCALLCTDVLQIPTSCKRRLVDFLEDC